MEGGVFCKPGFTYRVENVTSMSQNHPRTRGENHRLSEPYAPSAGSPLHTQGKSYLIEQCHHIFRVTPAHAGKILYHLTHILYTCTHLKSICEINKNKGVLL